MTEEVKISMVLSETSRDPEAVAQVQEIAESLGLKTTRAGLATISFSASKEVCQELFGQEPTPVEPREATTAEDDQPFDFGAAGGFVAEGMLRIPEALAEAVDAISIEPPARRLFNPLPTGGPTNASEEEEPVTKQEANKTNEASEACQPASPTNGEET